MELASLTSELPIVAVLAPLQAALDTKGVALLVAPPGAGKTTGVPLALLAAPWRLKKEEAGQKGVILVLEPRRIAARASAARMATLLGEKLGETIGLQTRFDTQKSAKTRILVVTEGVFTRMILDDPELTHIAAILFDEFHERSLDADFGLALALETRAVLRPDLRLLIMSATLDDQRIARFLQDAPIITSEGRTFPIETRYQPRDLARRLEEDVANLINKVLAQEAGSILVFLPGQGEIERVKTLLEARNLGENIHLFPLYGTLSPEKQDEALRPLSPPWRKIVLATSLAETSLTIEGVRIVIDSGLMRVPRFEPDLGVTRLETVRVSRASADQRRGRAGRREPGIAYRLWNEAQDQGLIPFARPEILESDLTAFRLDCALAGEKPENLALIDPAPLVALREAEKLLVSLQAMDEQGRITTRGRRIQNLPLPPRLAALLLDGAQNATAPTLNQLALASGLISERGVGGTSPNLMERLEKAKNERGGRAQKLRQMAEKWVEFALKSQEDPKIETNPLSLPMFFARAFPDRVAKNRGGGRFQLAQGRAAMLDEVEPLAHAPFLVVVDLTGQAQRARITQALELTQEELEIALAGSIQLQDEISFDHASRSLRRRANTRLGALNLNERMLPVTPSAETARLLAQGAALLGIDTINWSGAQRALRQRVGFLRRNDEETWPDLSETALAQNLEWLTPFLEDLTGLDALDATRLGAALEAFLPYSLRQKLESEAPTHYLAPTGNHHPIRYEGENAPFISLRVQELFGLKEHPKIAGGKVKLTLELLSPAHRPIQITQDLPRFWAGSWGDVRADLRGRYPKHVWPEDPANASPTARAKPRGM